MHILIYHLGPKDYEPVAEVLVFPVGSLEGQSLCLSVRTHDDTVVEYTEYFAITLSAVSPNVTIGDRAGGVTYTVGVFDNDGEATHYHVHACWLYNYAYTDVHRYEYHI